MEEETPSSLQNQLIQFALVTGATLLTASYYEPVAPYMDEVFHVPQAQLICNKDFSTWNNKITTYPGLYYTSYVIKIVAQNLFYDLKCSHGYLRLTNVIAANALYDVLFATRIHLTGVCDLEGVIMAALLFLYPINAFYYFLYYTDTLSTVAVIVTYLLTLQRIKAREQKSPKKGRTDSLHVIDYSLRYYAFPLMACSYAIFMRQTNAVWVLFFAGIQFLSWAKRTQKPNEDAWRDDSISVSNFAKLLLRTCSHWKQFTVFLTVDLAPYTLPLTIFSIFVWLNKGIVLGDKESHKPALHLAMPLHALCLSTFLLLPSVLLQAARLVYSLLPQPSPTLTPCGEPETMHVERQRKHRQHVISALLQLSPPSGLPEQYATGCMEKKNDNEEGGASVRWIEFWWRRKFLILAHFVGIVLTTSALVWGSRSHPFLLADNRHYTFYLWRRVLSKVSVRVILGPLYYVAVLITVSRIISARGVLWAAGFVISTALALVPTPLLEPRYFTATVVIALLSGPRTVEQGDHKGIISMIACVVVCLISTSVCIYVFLFKPFYWHDGALARFMP